jgi:hypothetical protein
MSQLEFDEAGLPDDAPVQCDNCDWEGPLAQVERLVGDVESRLQIGGEVPAGECPDCGGLCYLVTAISPLQAASHDLLDVCCEARDILCELGCDDMDPDDSARLLLDRMLAVIAKAQGEAP